MRDAGHLRNIAAPELKRGTGVAPFFHMNWDKRLKGYQGELGAYRRQFILTAIRLCQSPTQMIQDLPGPTES